MRQVACGCSQQFGNAVSTPLLRKDTYQLSRCRRPDQTRGRPGRRAAAEPGGKVLQEAEGSEQRARGLGAGAIGLLGEARSQLSGAPGPVARHRRTCGDGSCSDRTHFRFSMAGVLSAHGAVLGRAGPPLRASRRRRARLGAAAPLATRRLLGRSGIHTRRAPGEDPSGLVASDHGASDQRAVLSAC